MPILGNPNLARFFFARRNVQPPTQFYVTPDDYLSVTFHTYNQLPLTLNFTTRVRLLRPDGTVQIMVWPKALGVFDVFEQESYQLEEGSLLGVSVTPASQSINRGQVFVTVELTKSRGAFGVKTAVLASDYLGLLNPVGWPGGRIISAAEGPGNDHDERFAAPGAGNPHVITVPAFNRWMLKGVYVSLTTDAFATNRQFQIYTQDNAFGPPFFQVLAHATVNQAAGTTYTYRCGWNEQLLGPGVSNTVYVPIPRGLWIRQGVDIYVTALALHGGDVLGACDVWVERAMAGA